MQEGDVEFGAAHDKWLADYKSYDTDAYCANPECERYGEPYPVHYESEFGQGSICPEECPDCKGDLSLDPPPELEDEEEEL